MIIEIGRHEIELYDNTQNLPVLRFQKFNKYLMLANEVGNTFADYDQRTARALAFLQKDMVKEAQQELINRRQAVFNAYNQYSPSGKAFAILVKRINDKQFTGISGADLDLVLKELDRIGLGHADSLEKLEEVKKKSRKNLLFTFLNTFRAWVTRNKPR